VYTFRAASLSLAPVDGTADSQRMFVQVATATATAAVAELLLLRYYCYFVIYYVLLLFFFFLINAPRTLCSIIFFHARLLRDSSFRPSKDEYNTNIRDTYL